MTELSLMQVNETWNIKSQMSGCGSELFVVFISHFHWLVWTFSNLTCFASLPIAHWCFPFLSVDTWINALLFLFERIVLFFLFSFYSELFPFFRQSFLHDCVWSFKRKIYSLFFVALKSIESIWFLFFEFPDNKDVFICPLVLNWSG